MNGNDLVREIGELESKCRRAIQYDSVFNAISADRSHFNKICALMDFIGDSNLSLDRIITREERSSIEPYFLAYGILQLLYARQSALRDVLKCLGLDYQDIELENDGDNIRHRIIGHPTSSDRSSHVIVRNSLSIDGFRYQTYRDDGSRDNGAVNYKEMLDSHLVSMKIGMERLYAYVSRFENDRRELMRSKPLSPRLQGASYSMQQLYAAHVDERYGQVFDAAADSLLNSLHEIREGLSLRLGEERTRVLVDPAVAGIGLMKSRFPPNSESQRAEYEVIAEGVSKYVDDLERMASEIDEEESQMLS